MRQKIISVVLTLVLVVGSIAIPTENHGSRVEAASSYWIVGENLSTNSKKLTMKVKGNKVYLKGWAHKGKRNWKTTPRKKLTGKWYKVSNACRVIAGDDVLINSPFWEYEFFTKKGKVEFVGVSVQIKKNKVTKIKFWS